ncbi:MAG: hypothetical protein AB1646_11755 [Thermodesulfobacteriota bacterium]
MKNFGLPIFRGKVISHPVFSCMCHEDPDFLVKKPLRLECPDVFGHYPIIIAHWFGLSHEVCFYQYHRPGWTEELGAGQVYHKRLHFESEDEAVQYARSLGLRPKNPTDEAILICVRSLYRKRPRGGDRHSADAKAQRCSQPGLQSRSRSARELAAWMGISPRKVEQAERVLKYGDEELFGRIRDGSATIRSADLEIRRRKEQSKSSGDPIQRRP